MSDIYAENHQNDPAPVDDLIERLNDPHRRLTVSDRQEAAFEIARLRAAQEWQDISTAPKAELLVGMRFLFGRWDEDRFDWIVSGFFDAYGAPWHDGKSVQAFALRPPTHFMRFDRWSMPPAVAVIADKQAT